MMPQLETFSRLSGLPIASCSVLLVLLMALLLGTACRGLFHCLAPDRIRPTDWKSLGSWWVLFLVFSGSILIGRWGVFLVTLAASCLGLYELSGPTRNRYGRSLVLLPTWLVAGFGYVCVAVGLKPAFDLGVPLAAILFLPLLDLIHGRVHGFIQQTGGACWSVLLLTYGLMHLVWLWDLEQATAPWAGPAGLVIFIVMMTQLNDISQAIWGRWLGRHAITPIVSPHKTWEGFCGGILTTVLIGLIMAPWLTPVTNAPRNGLAPIAPALPISQLYDGPTLFRTLPICLLISLGGFCGDITLSAVKRDLGIKDSGTLLPGQGGMLDRIDSLTFTAPLFYGYLLLFYVP